MTFEHYASVVPAGLVGETSYTVWKLIVGSNCCWGLVVVDRVWIRIVDDLVLSSSAHHTGVPAAKRIETHMVPTPSMEDVLKNQRQVLQTTGLIRRLWFASALTERHVCLEATTRDMCVCEAEACPNHEQDVTKEMNFMFWC